MRTSTATLAASWQTPGQVFDHLEGTWSLERCFSDGTRMAGQAVFARPLRHTDAWLDYREEVLVHLPHGPTLQGSRGYLFERVEDGFIVHFIETPLRVFHHVGLAVAGDAIVGSALHLCAADRYNSRYSFLPDDRFEIEHWVCGPRKSYTSCGLFIRKT